MGEIKESPIVAIRQNIVLGQSDLRDAVGALLEARVLAIEGEAESVKPEKRQESVAIESGEMSRGEKVSRSEPPIQIG